mmetsp:Transcript_59143/g.152080  ORF Transcript_59143/g.152080 Transcript_59143/m.152080 type:complete len:258 (-) Transcript_59143:829-1602(-)
MDHSTLGGDMPAHGRQDRANLLARQLRPEHGDELQAGGTKHRVLRQRLSPECRCHEAAEEVQNIDVLIDHRNALPRSLAAHGHCDAEVDARVLEALGLVCWDFARLLHQGLHVANEDLSDLGFAHPAHRLHQVHGASTPCLLVSRLHVSADVLQRIVLEELHVRVAEHDVREHHLLTNARQHARILEGRIRPVRRRRGRQEVNASRDKLVILLLLVQAHQQVPGSAHAVGQVFHELFLILVGVQSEALTHSPLHLLK